jgi:CMP-N-acetylneuraminic acid synthetase
MLDGKLVLALIPARGGSKGIPRKNIALLMGKPLLSYTIEAALSSVFVDEVWVSSEDREILQLASMCGARIVTRPYVFASDTASSVSVVEHFIAHLSNEIRSQDPIILYLQPTSPRSSKAF